MSRRGRCFALFFGLRLPLVQVKATVPRFFILYNLTAGRVKQTNFKMKKSLFTAFAVGLGLTASVMAQVPSYVPTNGLVGWWPFNGNANDESGNGNNGTVNGAILTTDRFGNASKAYSFDGVGNNIIVADNLLLRPSNISLSVWIKTDLTKPINAICIKTNFNNAQGEQYGIGVSGNGAAGFTIKRNSNCLPGNGWQDCSTATGVVIPNVWQNLVSTYDGVTIKYYINGMIVQTAVPPAGNIDNCSGGNLNIGQFWSGQPDYFKGQIDDIGIWNRALSDCEIQDLYNSQINSVTGSIAVSPNSASIGSNVTLSTTTNSTNVQWQTNGVNLGWQNVPSNSSYSGGTTNTLTVNNVQLSNHNQPFRVIGSNGNCTDTSNVASIQISDTCITNVTVYDTLLTTVTDTLIINTTLSLPAPNNENTILIYPNPASDHITIDNGNFAAMSGYSIKITNNAGQEVFQSPINQTQFYVDLSTWSGNGLYFVHLIDSQNNTVTVRKIVLQ
jgi:hypothetical protein